MGVIMELKPCPFCGGIDGINIIHLDRMTPNWFVACDSCGCTGSSKQTENSCKNAWNDRHYDKKIMILESQLRQFKDENKRLDDRCFKLEEIVRKYEPNNKILED